MKKKTVKKSNTYLLIGVITAAILSLLILGRYQGWLSFAPAEEQEGLEFIDRDPRTKIIELEPNDYLENQVILTFIIPATTTVDCYDNDTLMNSTNMVNFYMTLLNLFLSRFGFLIEMRILAENLTMQALTYGTTNMTEMYQNSSYQLNGKNWTAMYNVIGTGGYMANLESLLYYENTTHSASLSFNAGNKELTDNPIEHINDSAYMAQYALAHFTENGHYYFELGDIELFNNFDGTYDAYMYYGFQNQEYYINDEDATFTWTEL